MVIKKREDTVEGCHGLAEDDKARAAAADSDRMRHTLERSAAAWTGRAKLLERLARNFSERADVVSIEQQRRRAERKANG
jgi:hypothetical protein